MRYHKRIVQTGGPCGGKTTTNLKLQKELKLPYLFIEEAATAVLENGWPKRELVDQGDAAALAQWHLDFQREVFRYQTKLNQDTTDRANSNRFKAAIFDRDGIYEGAAYWPAGFANYEQAFGLSLREVDTEIDLVIFHETMAMTRPELFGQNNEHRYETSVEEAIAVNNRILEIYKDHPNFRFIPSTIDLRERVRIANMWIHDLIYPNL